MTEAAIASTFDDNGQRRLERAMDVGCSVSSRFGAGDFHTIHETGAAYGQSVRRKANGDFW